MEWDERVPFTSLESLGFSVRKLDILRALQISLIRTAQMVDAI